MNTYEEPICPFEGCEAVGRLAAKPVWRPVTFEEIQPGWEVRTRRRDGYEVACGNAHHQDDDGDWRTEAGALLTYGAMSWTYETTAPKPELETDPRHAHDPWILPTREQVARALFASTYGDDGEQWDEATGVRHDFYLDDADAVLALLSPWRPVEPGTTIKAGTRYRIEEPSGGCYEHTALADWEITSRSNRTYIDPRTVPAEPDPRVKVVAQVLAEKAGISLDEAEATLVVQAIDRMGDDSVTYPTTNTTAQEDFW